MEITVAQARAFALARHGLAVRHPDVLTAVEASAGVFGSAPTCYVSCAARVDGFRLGRLDEELYERKSLVRLRCMHEMSFAVPAHDVSVTVAATRVDASRRILRLAGLSEEEYATLSARILEVMSGRSATVAEIRPLLDDPPPNEVLRLVVALMGRQNRIVRTTVRGSWRSDTYAYAPWEEWVGSPLEDVDPVRARAELARRYFRAMGPAGFGDLKWWAGWTVRDTKAAVAALDLTPVNVDDAEVLVLTEDLESVLGAEPVRGVRLLPYWDAYTMGYASRTRIAPAADLPRVYDKAGNATSVVLVDGVVAGVWEFDLTEDSLAVRVAMFRSPGRTWPAIEAAAAELAAAAGVRPDVRPAPPTAALVDGARNAFMAPIRLGKALSHPLG